MGSIVNTIGPASTLPNEGFETYLSETTKIDVPFTTITNRAKIINLAADGGVRFGVNRIMIQDVKLKRDETGPNGEKVYVVSGDKFDQIRIAGNIDSGVGTSGTSFHVNPADDGGGFIEITFYGTGLNFITLANATDRDIQMHVDGVLVSNDIYGASKSAVISGRNYASNQIIEATSGLALGVHTVRFTNTANVNMVCYGFEIINESTQLDIRPNTAYVGGEPTLITQTTTDYNSGFTNQYGTPGTKGGHVVIYADSDGVVHKDIQYVDATPQYMGSTDHSNEEMIRNYHWREFGAGRTDDFSTMSGTGDVDKAFTLDDGITTLMCNNCDVPSGFSVLRLPAVGSYYTFTFVGTGLAFGNPTVAASTPVGISTTVEIDGVNIGDLNGAPRDGSTVEICSGLPYGTHTVSVTTQAAGQVWNVSDFIVYGPKKPTLPNNSVELASYYLMADYVANTTSNNTGNYISQGTLRKNCSREFVYTGTWLDSGVTDQYSHGVDLSSNTTGSTASLTFFGTGVDIIFDTSTSGNLIFSVDGSSDLSGFTTNVSFDPGLSIVHSFNPATGNLTISSGNPSGDSIMSITGLTLGLHTVTWQQNTSSSNSRCRSFDVITPIHSYKQNKPIIQSASEVGSQAIADTRNFKAFQVDDEPNYVKVDAVDQTITTTSTLPVPVEDMHGTIKTNGGPIEINFTSLMRMNAGTSNAVDVYCYVDGNQVGVSIRTYEDDWTEVSGSWIADVDAGFHSVQIFWHTSNAGNAAHSEGHKRWMTIKELK